MVRRGSGDEAGTAAEADAPGGDPSQPGSSSSKAMLEDIMSKRNRETKPLVLEVGIRPRSPALCSMVVLLILLASSLACASLVVSSSVLPKSFSCRQVTRCAGIYEGLSSDVLKESARPDTWHMQKQ